MSLSNEILSRKISIYLSSQIIERNLSNEDFALELSKYWLIDAKNCLNKVELFQKEDFAQKVPVFLNSSYNVQKLQHYTDFVQMLLGKKTNERYFFDNLFFGLVDNEFSFPESNVKRLEENIFSNRLEQYLEESQKLFDLSFRNNFN